MADASFLQPNFLGGEWAPYSQGRADLPEYRTALNLCRNAIPVEEGAVTRRPGFTAGGTTRNGAPGTLREFHFDQAHPYVMELTDGHMRFWSGTALATQLDTGVTAVSGNTITAPSHGFSTGDQVLFRLIGNPAGTFASIAPLLGKQWAVTVVDANNFTVIDAVSGATLSGVTLGGTSIHVGRIVDIATPYTSGMWASVRTAQDETDVLMFHPAVAPHDVSALTAETNTTTGFATFSLTTPTFLDGPYLDPPTDGSYLTPTGLSGTISLAEAGTAYAFVSTDVGRQIRLFSEPDFWNAATAYAQGDVVKFNNVYWKAQQANTGKQPDQDLTNWAIDPTAAVWTWGTIASVVSAYSITVTLAAADPNQMYAGGPLLYSKPIRTWRLGVYSQTTGYPTCGTFHEGRLWMAGANGNRVDSSMSNLTFRFSPTLIDGTVADNCGISATFRAQDINAPYWLLPDSSGIIVGTQSGEWMIRASSLNDPLTPTSIQAHRFSDFGSENVEARLLPLARAFIQRDGRKLIELTTAFFSSDRPYQGQNLSLRAKHFWADGVYEFVYQKEKTPIIWARTKKNELIGCTYRRDSQFSNQPVTFAGWHKHSHGCGRAFLSIQTGPSVGGDTDTLTVITQDDGTGYCYVELLTDIFQEDDTLLDAYFVDGAAVPAGSDLVTVSGVTYIRIYGLDYVDGETITAWIAGIDAGDYVVTAGQISVPIDQPGSLLTSAYLASVST